MENGFYMCESRDGKAQRVAFRCAACSLHLIFAPTDTPKVNHCGRTDELTDKQRKKLDVEVFTPVNQRTTSPLSFIPGNTGETTYDPHDFGIAGPDGSRW